MKDLVLVVGASGNVGSEIIQLLKEEGYRTRATTSKAVLSQENLVHANLVTGEGVKAAFENVDRAFLMAPPGYADQYSLLSPLIQEAKRRGLKKVVLMTALGANADETSPFRRAEIELEKSGLNYNIIRPNWFMQNFNTFWIKGILEQDQLLLPAGDAKTSFIDARDIAAVAAKLLISDQFDRQAFDLTGPESIDHAYVASILSEFAKRRIEYKNITPQAFKQDLLEAGLTEDYADFLGLIIGFLKAGYNAGITTSVQDITGVPPRSLSAYAIDYKNNWIQK